MQAGARSYGGIAVLVTDERKEPAPQARVTFRLPDEGPSGLFPNGQRTETAATDRQGRASIWGIRWGETPGICNIVITAKVAGATVGVNARVTIVAKARGEASFEIPIAPPKPADAGPLSPPTPPTATPPASRPGVVFTRKSGEAERIPGANRKWLWISLSVAGAVGGGLAWHFSQQPAPTPALISGPRLTLGPPAITIGKP
ncbi:MAG: hypothetical protein HY235_09385 [Acidobacteria bacterium]|nr:hypothetical protein [Acidobacteriota bacterium]